LRGRLGSSEVLPVNVTGAMSEDAVEAQRIEYTGIFGKEAADALIDQEFYCSFEAAILGAYWGKEILLAEQQGSICDVPVNTDLPVRSEMTTRDDGGWILKWKSNTPHPPRPT